jgi:antitoxin YefM
MRGALPRWRVASSREIDSERYLKMNILSYSQARASLKETMDNVCKDHIPTVITRQAGDHVVMVSLADYNSMSETLYLLGSAANAQRLRSSIAQVKAGKSIKRELITSEQKTKQQTGREV